MGLRVLPVTRNPLTRRRVLIGGAAALAFPHTVAASSLVRRRRLGVGRNADRVLTTFKLVEHSGGPSDCIKRIGLPIVPGDCPPGTTLAITGGSGDIAYQIDKISTGEFGEGTIFATAWVRDNIDYGPSESRDYNLVARPGGSYNNTSPHGLTDVLAGHDFRLEFTNITGSTSGLQPATLAVAQMNSHALMPTRVYATPIESGPVAVTFKMWGMVSIDGVDHPHLKTYDFITGLFDRNGNIIAWEPLFLVSQDWWSITGTGINVKQKLTYTATLKDASTVIETYGGTISSTGVRSATVQHPYHSRWATRRLTDDNEHAAEHRIGRARSNILYVQNQDYWLRTNRMPHLDMSYKSGAYMPVQVTTGPAYGIYKPNLLQPCSSQAQQPAIDSTGGSQSRGILTGMDCIAFMTQSANDVRLSRVNAQTGHHVPYHRRSNRTRLKPGDTTSDIASTPVSLILRDDRGTSTPLSYYDFTSYGLPVPVDAYASGTTATAFRDGFIQPTGGYAVGGSTWGPSTAPTHAGAYSQYNYLLEGSPDLLEAVIDLAINVSQQQNDVGGAASLLWYQSSTRVIFPGTPSTRWSGTALRPAGGNVRAMGWAANLMGHSWIVPDYEENARYIRTFVKHNARFANAHIQYLPATWTGSWWPIGSVGGTSPEIPWHVAIIGMGAWMALQLTGDETWRPFAEKISTISIWYGANDRVGLSASFEYQLRPSDNDDWKSVTNDFFQVGLFEHSSHASTTPSISAATGQLSNIVTRSNLKATLNDLVVFDNKDDGGAVAPVPSEVQLGRFYYLRNPTGNIGDPFQVSGTPDDSGIIVFATDYPNIACSVQPQAAANPSDYHGTIYGADEYVWMHWAVCKMARRNGYVGVTDVTLANYQKWANVYFDPLNLHSSADPYVVWALTG